MNAVAYLRKQIKSMQYLQDSVVKELTDELINISPPGTSSPIWVIWLHMVNGEDNFIATIQGRNPLWQSGGWKERFELESAPNIGEDWSDYQGKQLTIAMLSDYMAAVRGSTDNCLGTLEDEDLDDTVKFFTDSDPKANVWTLLITHSLIHTGEIAAIKGVLGEKGLPF